MSPIELLFTLNLLVLALGAGHAFVRRRLYCVIWFGLLAFHLAATLHLDEMLEIFRQGAIVNALLGMLVANTLLLMVCYTLDEAFLVPAQSRAGGSDIPMPAGSESRRYFLAISLLLVGALLMRFAANPALFFGHWVEARGNLGVAGVLGTILGFIIMPSIPLAFRERRIVFGSIMLIGGILYFVIIGSRAMFLTAAACLFLLTLRSMRLSWRSTVGLAILGGGVLLLHTVARVVRVLGLGKFLELLSSGALLEFFINHPVAGDWSGGESEIYRAYFFLFNTVPSEYPYFSAPTLIRLVLIYVPQSVLAGIKPPDITYILFDDVLFSGFMDRDIRQLALLVEAAISGVSGSLHPTLWGDAYANLGYTGFLVYPILFGVIFIIVEYYMWRLSFFAYFTLGSMVAVGYLMVARGNIIPGFSYLAYGGPLLLAIFLVARIRLCKRERT